MGPITIIWLPVIIRLILHLLIRMEFRKFELAFRIRLIWWPQNPAYFTDLFKIILGNLILKLIASLLVFIWLLDWVISKRTDSLVTAGFGLRLYFLAHLVILEVAFLHQFFFVNCIMPCSLLYHTWIHGGNSWFNNRRTSKIESCRTKMTSLNFSSGNLRHFPVVAWCKKDIVLLLGVFIVVTTLRNEWIVPIDHLLEIDEIGEWSFLSGDAHPLLHQAVLPKFLLDLDDVWASHHMLFVVPTGFRQRWVKGVVEYWWSPFD